MVNELRIALARKRRGRTQSSLAAAVGVTARTLRRIETGECDPQPETLHLLAKELGFPKAFFELPDPPSVNTDAVSFRALSKMTAGRRDSALGAAELAIELSEFIATHFDLPAPNVPVMHGVSTPELAADQLRGLWGLGEKPIRNVVHVIESHGVRVFSLVEDCDAVDAFSFWRDDVPFVFLNTRKSAERSRFDACHELAHLVLHGHAKQGGREAEIDADRFAAAFLMPKSSVLAHVPPLVTLDSLVQMKAVWRVSVGALIQRLHSLEVLSEWRHRALWMEASQRGYRTSEPKSTGCECSQVLGKVFAALSKEGVSRADLAAQLHFPPEDLDALVLGRSAKEPSTTPRP